MKTLRLYRVVGAIAHISAGAVIALTDEQLAPRRHRVAVVETIEGGAIVRAEQPLEFKVGETLGLADKPEKAQAERLVPVDGEDDGRERRGAVPPKAKPPRNAPKKPVAPKGPAAAPPAPPAGSEAATGLQAGDGGAAAPLAPPAVDPAVQPPAAT